MERACIEESLVHNMDLENFLVGLEKPRRADNLLPLQALSEIFESHSTFL